MSLWDYFAHASFFVQLIMLVLVGFSVLSWIIIFHNISGFGQIRRNIREFKQQFWSASDLTNIYTHHRQTTDDGLASLFVAGFKEFLRVNSLKQAGSDKDICSEQVCRAMKIVQIGTVDRLERRIQWLSIIGSVSPYIGLVGTVWGIMHALQSLSQVQHATVSMVAPGISEALVATAIGLFAAIPAVIANNWFYSHLTEVEHEYDMFCKELLNILELQTKD